MYEPQEVVSSFVSNSFSEASATSGKRKHRHIPRAFKKERQDAYGDLPKETLLATLIEAQYECVRLRSGMLLALERLKEESGKTDAAIELSEELGERVTRLQAQNAQLKSQVSEAREAVERWRVEYGHVRGRVDEGERVLGRVREELGDVMRREKEARRDAWRAEREMVSIEAVEEGRRVGMVDGYRRAMAERGRRRVIEEEVEEVDEEEEQTETEEEIDDDDRSSFYDRPPVGAPPPIIAIPTPTNSPPRPVTPAVEHWSTDVPPPAPPTVHSAFHTPPDNLVPVVSMRAGSEQSHIAIPPPHEFDGSMHTPMRRASPSLHAAPSLHAPTDSTTISNIPITQSTPAVLPPADQFQLSRTDEWDQSATPRPSSRQSHARPLSYAPSQNSYRNPDITPFDPGLTPSIRRFDRLPNSRPASVMTRKSRLSVANPDPPAGRPVSTYSNARPQSQNHTPNQMLANLAGPSTSQINLAGLGVNGLRRVPSTLSQRTGGKYDHYNGTPNDDPAMWGRPQ